MLLELLLRSFFFSGTIGIGRTIGAGQNASDALHARHRAQSPRDALNLTVCNQIFGGFREGETPAATSWMWIVRGMRPSNVSSVYNRTPRHAYMIL